MTTTTTHRPGCSRPGWDVTPPHGTHQITVARCRECAAVELRKGTR
jgi:hypothetical protein